MENNLFNHYKEIGISELREPCDLSKYDWKLFKFIYNIEHMSDEDTIKYFKMFGLVYQLSLIEKSDILTNIVNNTISENIDKSKLYIDFDFYKRLILLFKI